MGGARRGVPRARARPLTLRTLALPDLLAALFAAIAGPALWAAFDLEYDPRLGLVIWIVGFPIVWLVALSLVGAHEPGLGRPNARAATAIAQALFLVTAGVLLVFYLRPFVVPRGSSLVSLALVLPATLGARAVYARRARRAGRRAVVVLGTDPAACRASEAALEADAGLRVVAFVDERGPTSDGEGSIPVLDLGPGLWPRVAELGAEVIVVGHTSGLSARTRADLARCFEHGVEAIPATTLYEDLTGRVMADALEADWYADLPTRARGVYPLIKRAADIALAFAVGVVLSPLLVAIATAILVDSGRPILLRQVRVGRRGREFVVHKFRSMHRGAEPDGRPVWASTDDLRRTHVGRFLRERRLDELPQLWDVLRGAMSLIGPRPERPGFAERLAAQMPLYSARALVRPGITGWAQVRYPYAASIEENLAKLEYDLYYVRHLGPLLDLTIAVRTVLILLGLGASAARAK